MNNLGLVKLGRLLRFGRRRRRAYPSQPRYTRRGYVQPQYTTRPQSTYSRPPQTTYPRPTQPPRPQPQISAVPQQPAKQPTATTPHTQPRQVPASRPAQQVTNTGYTPYNSRNYHNRNSTVTTAPAPTRINTPNTPRKVDTSTPTTVRSNNTSAINTTAEVRNKDKKKARTPIRVYKQDGEILGFDNSFKNEVDRINAQMPYAPRINIRAGRQGPGDSAYAPLLKGTPGRHFKLYPNKSEEFYQKFPNDKYRYFGTTASSGIAVDPNYNNTIAVLHHELAHAGVADVTGNTYRGSYRDDTKAGKDRRRRATEFLSTGSAPSNSYNRIYAGRRTALKNYYYVDPNFDHTFKAIPDAKASDPRTMDTWQLQYDLINPPTGRPSDAEIAYNLTELEEFMKDPDADKFNTPDNAVTEALPSPVDGTANTEPTWTSPKPDYAAPSKPTAEFVTTLKSQGPDYLRRAFRGGTTSTNNGGTKALEAANNWNDPKTKTEMINSVKRIQSLLKDPNNRGLYGVIEVINRWGITPDFDTTHAYNVMPLRDLKQLEDELNRAIHTEPRRQKMNDAVNSIRAPSGFMA